MDFDNNNPVTNDDDQQDVQGQQGVPAEGGDSSVPTEPSQDAGGDVGGGDSAPVSEDGDDQGSDVGAEPSSDNENDQSQQV
ncbi:hypothetical protein DYH10_04080 [Candidatus Saccharibacteria bacterium CPR2]|nr:hypothetical protein [Candidatus Saccharibacteria bacterium CPR2]